MTPGRPRIPATPSKRPYALGTPARMLASPRRRALYSPNLAKRDLLGAGPSSSVSASPGGDRFIPVRAGQDLESASFKILNDQHRHEPDSPNAEEKRRAMRQQLTGSSDSHVSRILNFAVNPQAKLDEASEQYEPTIKAKKRGKRYIPQAAERVLDAPEIVNDYYLSLLDWSTKDVIAVALGRSIYLWNASTGATHHLLELDPRVEATAYVSSLRWLRPSSHLAVGDSSGAVSLWDPIALKRIRTMAGHESRVASLAWNRVSAPFSSLKVNVVFSNASFRVLAPRPCVPSRRTFLLFWLLSRRRRRRRCHAKKGRKARRR